MIRFLSLLIFFFSAFSVSAQVGTGNMAKMNTLLQQYGGAATGALQYDATYGMVHQSFAGYTDRYKISNIKSISVREVDNGFTVEFACDSTDPCISHIGANSTGTYLASAIYSFSSEKAALQFSSLARQIIKTDFKKDVIYRTTSNEGGDKVRDVNEPGSDALSTLNQSSNSNTKKVETISNSKPKGNHLSVDVYNGDGDMDYKKTLSAFGKHLLEIFEKSSDKQLAKIKGTQVDGAYQSRIKLPKAKRNYIYQYKEEDCFIAEFGTKKYYEDLQDLYFEIKDEIDGALPEDYEATDMAYEKIYENSDDEVFHTEYYHFEDASLPSIVIRIAPDGKSNTLFLRIGKR